MKLIQIHPQSSFLTFQGMTINVAGSSILFGGLDNTTLHQFDCFNDFVAQELYKYLISCLVDAESFEADLPYRHAILVDCWSLAPTLIPAMNAIRVISVQKIPFQGMEELRQTYENIDPTWRYADKAGFPNLYGNIAWAFWEIQQQSDKSKP